MKEKSALTSRIFRRFLGVFMSLCMTACMIGVAPAKNAKAADPVHVQIYLPSSTAKEAKKHFWVTINLKR